MSINEGIGNSDTLMIYHRVDWDGYTSGAVALKAMPNADATWLELWGPIARCKCLQNCYFTS